MPVAGLGTRLLPLTKAIPKEMLPIFDKPIIQHIIEEINYAGFEEIIFITHSSKYSIEDHFDKSFELETVLEKRIKKSYLKEIKAISKLDLSISSIRQGEAKGLGHAILCAKKLIGDDPFAIALPDMLISNLKGRSGDSLKEMKDFFEENQKSSILLGEALKEEIHKFGIVKINKKLIYKKFYKVEKIIEKPSIKKAPSNLFAAGRYVFTSKLMDQLSKVSPDKSGEIQLTDAIDKLISLDEEILGLRLKGKVYDCGERDNYILANIDFALKDPNLKSKIKDKLKKI